MEILKVRKLAQGQTDGETAARKILKLRVDVAGGRGCAHIFQRNILQQIFDAPFDLGHRVPDGAAAELFAALAMTIRALEN